MARAALDISHYTHHQPPPVSCAHRLLLLLLLLLPPLLPPVPSATPSLTQPLCLESLTQTHATYPRTVLTAVCLCVHV
jgi:hypothetical protein